jgi:hypothetical protein
MFNFQVSDHNSIGSFADGGNQYNCTGTVTSLLTNENIFGNWILGMNDSQEMYEDPLLSGFSIRRRGTAGQPEVVLPEDEENTISNEAKVLLATNLTVVFKLIIQQTRSETRAR